MKQKPAKRGARAWAIAIPAGILLLLLLAAFLIGIIPAVVCDRHMKSTGALTFTIVRLF